MSDWRSCSMMMPLRARGQNAETKPTTLPASEMQGHSRYACQFFDDFAPFSWFGGSSLKCQGRKEGGSDFGCGSDNVRSRGYQGRRTSAVWVNDWRSYTEMLEVSIRGATSQSTEEYGEDNERAGMGT